MQMRDLAMDLHAWTQSLPVYMHLEGIAQYYELATECFIVLVFLAEFKCGSIDCFSSQDSLV